MWREQISTHLKFAPVFIRSLKKKHIMSNFISRVHASGRADGSASSSPAGWAARSRCKSPGSPSQQRCYRNPSPRCTGFQRSPRESRLSIWQNKEPLGDDITAQLRLIRCTAWVNLRAADYFDGACGGFEANQLDIRNGLGHFEGVLILRVLLFLLWLFEHHHQGVRQVLQENKKKRNRISRLKTAGQNSYT